MTAVLAGLKIGAALIAAIAPCRAATGREAYQGPALKAEMRHILVIIYYPRVFFP